MTGSRRGMSVVPSRPRIAVILVLVALLAGTGVVSAGHNEHPLDSPCYVVLEATGEVLLVTGLEVNPGDEYLAGDNRLYRIVRVDGDIGYAVFLERVDLAAGLEVRPSVLARLSQALPIFGFLAQERAPVVGIYHTHGAESYEPTDGTDSRDEGGGILEVGDSLARALERQGIRTLHDRTLHVPHDAGAYNRSRRTAVGLLRQGATVLLDVHRDTTPPDVYRNEVAGQPVAQVMLVVGRQNPARDANVAWARRVKAAADRDHPGLLRGIFIGRGSYNQDIGNRTILLEIGSHTVRREEAERGAALFAEVLPGVMGAAGAEAGGAWRALGLVLLLAVGGGALYLYVATGSWQAALDKARQFVRTEFGDFLRPLRLGPRGDRGRKGRGGA
ncbi:MAG: stage II sporulation protein P [bacterium]|nr:stage II sporulation protein P [bacterium]